MADVMILFVVGDQRAVVGAVGIELATVVRRLSADVQHNLVEINESVNQTGSADGSSGASADLISPQFPTFQ